MKSFMAAAVLVGGVIFPHAGNAGDILKDTFPLKQAAVAKAVHAVFEAAERADVDRLEALHLYGAKFSKFDDMPPSTRQDAASARENERAALTRLKSFSATVEDLRVDVLGSVAVATFILRYSFETADASRSSSARSTMVFVEVAGSWKILHEHFSQLATGE
jgi:ketosteroid isomerase-like protein